MLLGVTYVGFQVVPSGFVPGQDKQYLVGFAQLPDGASLDRTEEVIRRMSEIALKTPGVKDAVALPRPVDRRLHQRAQCRHRVLRPRRVREAARRRQLSGGAIAGAINQQLGGIQDAFIAVFPPPPVNGLGTIGGFKLQVEDRAGLGDQALYDAMKAMQMRAWQTPELAACFSSFQINVPQLYADVDRAKAKRMGVALTDVFDTMQINLGSLYVNDFNRFGRTYRVVVQADAPYRSRAEDIAQLKTRNAKGELVPLGSLLRVDVELRARPRDPLQRVPLGRPQRRRRAGLQLGPGAGRDRAHRDGDAAARHHASSGPTSPTRRSWPATRRCSSSRCACCSCSWCWRRSTRASSCRSRSS